jgi:Alanine racemase, N-terminal domain
LQENHLGGGETADVVRAYAAALEVLDGTLHLGVLDADVELARILDAYWPPTGKGSRVLETPHLLIDGAKLDRNVEKMAGIARERGLKLRPHVKTHKIPMIARRQLEAGAAGIIVAKVSEAEVMADGGIRDIFT